MTKESISTPYDDAFRTLLVKCPTLVIPLVNETFHEKYELRENVSVFHNEFFVGNEHQKERITDSHIGIRGKRYHTECQSNADSTITVQVSFRVPNGYVCYEIPLARSLRKSCIF